MASSPKTNFRFIVSFELNKMSPLHDRSTIGNLTFSSKFEIKYIGKMGDKAALDMLGDIINGHDCS